MQGDENYATPPKDVCAIGGDAMLIPDEARGAIAPPDRPMDATRRIVMAAGLAMLVSAVATRAKSGASAGHPQIRWYEAAADMRRLAESSGDQPYGAVLVLGTAIVGEGPSRVIRNGDGTAHAEREAIRDARRRLGKQALRGAVLYSTSRPCSACEAAAAEAGVSRMYFGSSLVDAGPPGGER